ncbi:MAG: M81 family metallopeptidase [Candidatus Pelethousia sp.]|nr:M81 family metallopeptidase [Candidatus Pelethousia sp.]
MKNILIAEFKHETNCLSPNLTDETAYRARIFLRNNEIPQYYKNVKTEVGAFLDVFADKPDFCLVPAIALNAMPAGPVTMDMFYTVRDAILEKIRELEHVDGILLCLHGAMVLTEFDDGEGLLLEAIRAQVGPDIPIITSLDLHANITKRMIANATAFFVFDYYPHTDMYEAGLAAAHCMYDTLSGRVKPTMACHKLPMLLSYMPTALPQMKKFVDKEHAYEEMPGVLGVNVCHGFFPADLEEQGVAVIAVTDNDKTRAQHIADTLAQEIWEDRRLLVRDFYTIDQAIDEAAANEGAPFVFADVADNPGAGSGSDGTHILRRLLEREVKNVAIATIVDPQAVETAEKAGVGNMVEVSLGGKTSPDILGAPINVTAYVKALLDGTYTNRDEMSHGLQNRMGKTAVLVVNGIEIITTTNRVQPWDLEAYRACGIMPQDKKILVTKSTLHYKNSFGKVAFKTIDVEVPGLAPQSPQIVTSYKRCRRPIYPLDEI